MLFVMSILFINNNFNYSIDFNFFFYNSLSLNFKYNSRNILYCKVYD